MTRTRWMAAGLAVAAVGVTAYAHFQVLVPPTDVVAEPGPVALDLLFTHPMEQGPAMTMGKPRQFGVLVKGRKRDLLATLKEKPFQGKTGYTTTFQIEEPGDHVFFIEPAPYWEPAEEKMIVHYTKVVVNAMELEEGWDALVGLPVEIEPLVRPYGLWTGNVFRGIVRKNGRPVPFAEVEVEYWNAGKRVAIPAGPYVTQVVKADQNGTFTYAMPRAGWWGFAALVDGDEQMRSPTGKMVDVELGALMWVRCVDMTAAE